MKATDAAPDVRRPRQAARAVICLYALLLAAFALPFITISSCGVKTEPLTGWDLVLSKDPTIPQSQAVDLSPAELSEKAKDADEAASHATDAARVELILVLAAIGLALVFSLRGAPPVWLATVLLYDSLLIVMAHGSISAEGTETRTTIEWGYQVAAALAVAGPLLSYRFVRLSRGRLQVGLLGQIGMVALGVALLFGGALGTLLLRS